MGIGTGYDPFDPANWQENEPAEVTEPRQPIALRGNIIGLWNGLPVRSIISTGTVSIDKIGAWDGAALQGQGNVIYENTAYPGLDADGNEVAVIGLRVTYPRDYHSPYIAPNLPDPLDPRRAIVGWPDAPAVRMATNARFVKLPADKAKQALAPAIGEHLGQPLPEGTEITHIGVQGGDVIVEFRHPDFGELPPGVSQELKPREKKP